MAIRPWRERNLQTSITVADLLAYEQEQVAEFSRSFGAMSAEVSTANVNLQTAIVMNTNAVLRELVELAGHVRALEDRTWPGRARRVRRWARKQWRRFVDRLAPVREIDDD